MGTSLWIAHSRFGLGLRAIRDDRDVAESLGVPTARYQLYALSISSFLAGMAGSFYAQYIFFVVPEEVFGFDLSISMILMALIGGLGTILGPVGRRGFVLAPRATRTNQLSESSPRNLRVIAHCDRSLRAARSGGCLAACTRPRV